LPELTAEEVDLRTDFLGYTVAAPIFISCMTGGSDRGFFANRELAKAAGEKRYPVGMGSIRILFDHPELFEHFHRYPELSFLEKKTAKRLARELRKAGAEVTEGVGGTGVVGMMRNGEGPLVLVRADMDGLPIEERSGLDDPTHDLRLQHAQRHTSPHRSGSWCPLDRFERMYRTL
jgi:hypothetical protein